MNTGIRHPAPIFQAAGYCVEGAALVMRAGNEHVVGHGLVPTNLGEHLAKCAKCEQRRRKFAATTHAKAMSSKKCATAAGEK